ncbi:MAG: hypothetical protein ACKVP0_18415 [Pirellulaceae bacterium]
MCCDLLFVILICKHVGDMVQEKGHSPLPYQIMMGIGWIGGGLIGGVIGFVLAAMVIDDGDAVGLAAALGYALGVACGAGPTYLVAMSVKRDPNYRPPMPAPGTSPYGPPPGATVYGAPLNSANPYSTFAPQNPTAKDSAYPQQPSPPAATGAAPGAAAAPGIPSFLPASAFAPANSGPKRVQFHCPGGHVLEEWSTSAGQQRRCPHCGGVATVPNG